MKAKRKRHQPEFKARVALEALQGVKTIQQIAKEYQIHPVQASEWKKIMAQGAAEVFRPVRAQTTEQDFARERKQLQAGRQGSRQGADHSLGLPLSSARFMAQAMVQLAGGTLPRQT